MGPTWDPLGSCRPQMEPMLAPWTLLSGYFTRDERPFWYLIRRFGSLWDISLRQTLMDVYWFLLWKLIAVSGFEWNPDHADTNRFNSLAPGKFEWHFRHVIFKQIKVIDGWSISSEIALIRMSLDFADDQSTLVQIMALCRQATSHYLSQCWSRSLSPYGVTSPKWVKVRLSSMTPLHKSSMNKWLQHVGAYMNNIIRCFIFNISSHLISWHQIQFTTYSNKHWYFCTNDEMLW